MKKTLCGITALLLVLCFVLSASAEWLALTLDGEDAYVRTTRELALREEPTTSSAELGTHDLGDREVMVCGRYWDEVNEIWWLECGFETAEDPFLMGWTGAQRFDITEDELYELPLYEYVPDDWEYPDADLIDYEIYAEAIEKLSLREEPTTKSKDRGTYSVKGEWILLTGRHWDSANGIWWVEAMVPYGDGFVTGWTGLKRFDSGTFDLENLQEY